MWQMVKRSTQVAWPLMGSRLLVSISNFFSMWLVASLGGVYLAASALIFVTQIVITVVMSSLLFSISPIASRAFGSGDHVKVGSVAQQGWFLSAILTLPTLILLFFAQPILIKFGQDPKLAEIVGSYFKIYVLGIIPMFFFSTNQMLMAGIGRQKLAFAASAVATGTLVILAPLLTHGIWGMNGLGVKGVALAGALSLWAGLLFSVIYSLRLPEFHHFEFFRWRLSTSWGYLKQILAIGWPISMQVASELLAWFVITLFIGWLGEFSLSAQQTVNQFNTLIIVPIMGLSQASSILVGQASGAKEYHLVKRLGFTHMAMACVLMLIVLGVYLTMSHTLIQVFIDTANPANSSLIHLTTLLLCLSGVSLVFDGIRNVAMGSLRGVYDSRYPMLLSLIFIWGVGLPLGYHLAFALKLGVIGFAISGLLGMAMAAIVFVWRWHTRVNTLMARADLSDAKALQSSK